MHPFDTQVNQQRTLTINDFQSTSRPYTESNDFRSQRFRASLSSKKDSSEFSTNWWKLNTALAMTGGWSRQEGDCKWEWRCSDAPWYRHIEYHIAIVQYAPYFCLVVLLCFIRWEEMIQTCNNTMLLDDTCFWVALLFCFYVKYWRQISAI